VSQRPYLFAATAAENIALGQPEARRQDIERAARLAGADAFIEALPHGYDTPLGEQALRLSAGQRQRIALARAFLRDAPLLLLDEPTAHLDPLVAGQILAVIQTLMADRTVILVTHRHAWRGGADRVLTLEGGRLLAPALGEPAARAVAVLP
jgi:ABC-type multidrug transport system fused ATPase/permease subunit